MERKILKNIFDNLEKSLRSDMAIRIEHNLEDGKYREYLVTKILSKIIPSKYSITNGFIIDSDNKISQEMDIIIYDKSYVPPFFDETYTVVPIEAVIAIIQVKTTLTRDTINDAINNLVSIDNLNTKIGGKFISAFDGKIRKEERYISPYKIVVAYKTDIDKNYCFDEELKKVDMVYVVGQNIKEDDGKLIIKHRKEPEAIVNLNKDELIASQSEYNVSVINDSRLCNFALYLLEKMKLINNSIIINYSEYIKGAE